jgi:hypothetical protein
MGKLDGPTLLILAIVVVVLLKPDLLDMLLGSARPPQRPAGSPSNPPGPRTESSECETYRSKYTLVQLYDTARRCLSAEEIAQVEAGGGSSECRGYRAKYTLEQMYDTARRCLTAKEIDQVVMARHHATLKAQCEASGGVMWDDGSNTCGTKAIHNEAQWNAQQGLRDNPTLTGLNYKGH